MDLFISKPGGYNANFFEDSSSIEKSTGILVPFAQLHICTENGFQSKASPSPPGLRNFYGLKGIPLNCSTFHSINFCWLSSLL